MGTFFRIIMIGLLLGGIYGLVAMGLNLIFGVVRVVNFAQGELVMLGMYGAYLLNHRFGWNVYLTVLVVVPVMFALGLVIQRGVIQPLSAEPAMQLLATFGLVILFQNGVLALTKGETYTIADTFSRKTFDVAGAKLDVGRIVVLVTTTVVALALRWVLQETSFGRSVRAVTEDRVAARLMGINVERTFLITFGIGSGRPALARLQLEPDRGAELHLRRVRGGRRGWSRKRDGGISRWVPRRAGGVAERLLPRPAARYGVLLRGVPARADRPSRRPVRPGWLREAGRLMTTVESPPRRAVNPVVTALRGGAAGAGPRLAWGLYAGGIVVLALLLVAVSGDDYWLNIIILTYLFAGLAAGWNVIGGFGGQLSLGHGVYFAIGAYTVGVCFTKYGWSPWLTALLAIPIACAVAALTSWPTFRLRGPFFAMATLALNQVALVLALYFKDVTGGPTGVTIPFIPSVRDVAFVERWKYGVIVLVFVAVATAIGTGVSRSRLGYALRAVREDDEAAAAVGFNVFRTKMKGMLLSAAVTSVGGSIYAVYIRYLDPASALSLSDVSVRFVLICLLGGIGTVLGPVLGALVFIPGVTVLQAKLSGQAPGLNLVAVGALLVLIPLVLRRGIVGTVAGLLRSRIGRWGR